MLESLKSLQFFANAVLSTIVSNAMQHRIQKNAI